MPSGPERQHQRYGETKRVRGTTQYTRVNVRGSSLNTIDPSAGANRIDFLLPNIGGKFLQCSEVYLKGEMQLGSTDPGTDLPSCLDAQVILDRFDLLVGGRLVEQSLNCDVNMVHKNLEGSGMLAASAGSPDMLQPSDRQYLPQSRVAYDAGGGWVSFQIRLQNKSTELFGIETLGDSSTSVMLPVYALPTTQLTVFFREAKDVVSFDGPFDAGSVPTYKLRNIQLSCAYIESPNLASKLATSGYSVNWESMAYQRMAIGAVNAQTKFSLQIPSSYSSVNHVLGRFKSAGEYNVSDRDRIKLASTAFASNIQTANIRLNSKQRYREDLDSQECLQELRLMYPMATQSSFLTSYGADNAHQLWALLCGTDHADKYHVNGFKSSTSVGGITPEFSLDGALDVTCYADVWLSHNRIFTCGKTGICQVKY